MPALAAPDIRITVQRPPVQSDTAWIDAAVARQEAAVLGGSRRPVGIFARDAQGRVAGGISAQRIGPDFYVHLLWVDRALRGTGLGRALMLAAEHAAHARGAKRIFLNTITFQAPGFYARLGYAEEGRLVDFIQGSDRHYFRKSVAAVPLPALPAGLALDITDSPAKADVQAIDDGLTAHWNEHAAPYEEIAVLARGASGAPVAGAIGVLDNGSFTLVHIWTREEARGQGLGRRLARELEDAARAARCRHATAYPMDWQSPGFFERLGYAALFRVDDYTAGHGRTWMRKDLSA